MSEVRKCPKCGSQDFKNRRVKLPSASFGFFNPLIATAHVCNSCGYIEFYRE